MAMNKEERAAYEREWRLRNPDKAREYHANYMLKFVRERVVQFEAYRKTLACERCGFGDHRALEFHHRDPSQKKFSIGYGVRRFNWAVLKAEIDKCEIVCANCHRIEHYGNLPSNNRWGEPLRTAPGEEQLTLVGAEKA